MRRVSALLACNALREAAAATLKEIEAAGTFKRERVIVSSQQASIQVQEAKGKVLNFCANNYLGLANNQQIIAAAKKTLDERGFGMSSVRFICGTLDIHKNLEATITKFLGTEDTILYPSAFDANGGVFEALLGEQDCVISDALTPCQHHRRYPPLQGRQAEVRPPQHDGA